MNEAQKQMDALLSQSALTVPRFPPNSRYHATAIATLAIGGRVIAYLRRRFVPAPERFAPQREHEVVRGERPDLIAARELGDPELFWRLCDANGAIRPNDLTDTVGRRLRIPQPEGLPGPDDD